MSWPTKKIGEVCDFITPGIGEFRGAKKYIATADIDYDEIVNSVDITYGNRPSRANIEVRDGDVLVAKMAQTHKFLLATEKHAQDYIFSTGFAVLRARGELSPKYLFYFLTTKEFNNQKDSLATGATQKAINNSNLEKIKIFLPSIEIQKEIVERLDKITEAQKLNDDLIQKAGEFFQSLLHQELNPTGKDWEVKKMGEAFERITESVLPTKQPDQEFNFIGLENIESNTGQIVNLNPTKGKLIRSTKTMFRKNDVLYGKLRPYLNKAWLADTNGICSTDIWVLRAKQDVILPLLLSSILRQQRIVMKSSASMAGANLPRATKNVFDSIKVQLPLFEAQKQIVAKLSAVEEYKTQLLAQKSKLKELFDSALAKSMNQTMKTNTY